MKTLPGVFYISFGKPEKLQYLSLKVLIESGFPIVAILCQSGGFQRLIGDLYLGRFATTKVAEQSGFLAELQNRNLQSFFTMFKWHRLGCKKMPKNSEGAMKTSSSRASK